MGTATGLECLQNEWESVVILTAPERLVEKYYYEIFNNM